MQVLYPDQIGIFKCSGGGKLEYHEKNPWSKARTNNKLNPRDTMLKFNPGHIGGRPVFLPLCHPCSPNSIVINP